MTGKDKKERENEKMGVGGWRSGAWEWSMRVFTSGSRRPAELLPTYTYVFLQSTFAFNCKTIPIAPSTYVLQLYISWLACMLGRRSGGAPCLLIEKHSHTCIWISDQSWEMFHFLCIRLYGRWAAVAGVQPWCLSLCLFHHNLRGHFTHIFKIACSS